MVSSAKFTQSEAATNMQTPACNEAKNTLVFVQIPTHFKEMVRVAELLHKTQDYRPVVLFTAMYAGVADDIKRCVDQGIACITPDDFWKYIPETAPPIPPSKLQESLQELVCAAARTATNAMLVLDILWRLLSRWGAKLSIALLALVRSGTGVIAIIASASSNLLVKCRSVTGRAVRNLAAQLRTQAQLLGGATGRVIRHLRRNIRNAINGFIQLIRNASQEVLKATARLQVKILRTLRTSLSRGTQIARTVRTRLTRSLVFQATIYRCIIVWRLLPESFRRLIWEIRKALHAFWLKQKGLELRRWSCCAIRARATRNCGNTDSTAISRLIQSIGSHFHSISQGLAGNFEKISRTLWRTDVQRKQPALTLSHRGYPQGRKYNLRPIGAQFHSASLRAISGFGLKCTAYAQHIISYLNRLSYAHARFWPLLSRLASAIALHCLLPFAKVLLRHPDEYLGSWRKQLPHPLGEGVRYLALGLGYILLLPVLILRPMLRRVAVMLFGYLYKNHNEILPGDVRAQHYAWKMIPKMLDANAIDLVVLPEDNFYYFTNLYVQAIHMRGGAAVIVPFTVVNILEWAEAFYGSRSHDAAVPLNRLIGILFASWTYRHKNKALVMPPQQVLSNEYLKVAPPIPWLINSGYADALAAESMFMEQYYLSAGIEPKQIRFTGALYDDVVFQALANAATHRRDLYRRLALPHDRPMILCGLPPNQLAGDGRPQCVFTDYFSLLEAFISPLEKLSDEFNIVISLHPRITPQQESILAGRRVRVARDNIADLVPLSYFYIACCSATIRLAVSCGIPVINYDVFVYDYDDYKQVPGVITTDSLDIYMRAVEQLARSPDYYQEMRLRQEQFAKRQYMLDGKAGERLLALFDELTESVGKEPKPRSSQRGRRTTPAAKLAA